jgi:uncharacterized sporulation protein YeaH/YhbH (DUF444 family)
MPFIFIDRRKAGSGKSSPNRQKLIRRIKAFIKTSQPNNIGQGGVAGTNSKSSSPVKVAGQALDEPWFAYSKEGEHTIVIIGNREYDRGDEIEIPEEEEGGGGAGPGENGEDEFVVNVARDEFLDLFFEDCELPNLTHEKYTEKLDNKFQQSGFSTTGNPSQLSIIRSYKQMIGRRRALSGPYRQELEELEKELQAIYDAMAASTEEGLLEKHSSRINEIEERMIALHRKIVAIEGFDKTDLRFRKKEAKPLKTVDAVLVMIMDISGSMDETKKTIARRWFALLYAFIKRRYNNTELLFIAHTDEALEMNESDFFTTKVNGGTRVSPALKMVNQIIKERYDPNQTNIYISHASDGDNWDTDNPDVVNEMIGAGRLMSKVQFFSYVEVGRQISNTWFNTMVGSHEDTNLWSTYSNIRDKTPKNLSLAIIQSADDCYSVFKKVFKKGNSSK